MIGALIKFLFETVIALRYQQRISTHRMLRQYRYPLLRAADSLDRRRENFSRFADRRWYDDAHDDYYRVSTLYLFGTYLGWCKILEDSAYLELEPTDRKSPGHGVTWGCDDAVIHRLASSTTIIIEFSKRVDCLQS